MPPSAIVYKAGKMSENSKLLIRLFNNDAAVLHHKWMAFQLVDGCVERVRGIRAIFPSTI